MTISDSKNMQAPINRALVAFIGNLTYGDVSNSERVADALFSAGQIGLPNAEADVALAARLLVGLMATDSTVNVTAAIERFSLIPLRLLIRQIGERAPEAFSVEDMNIAPGFGHDFNRLSRDFVGALALLMEMEAREDQPSLSVRVIVRRTMGSPAAKIILDLAGLCGQPGSVELIYSADELLDDDRMLTVSELPASAFRRLALFACGDPFAKFVGRFLMEGRDGGCA